METWIRLGRGPLFQVALSLLLLGLLRLVLLTTVELVEAYWRSGDRHVKWRELGTQALHWLIPIGRLWRQRPLYSVVSVLFHVGMLLTPLFLGAHILLWKRTLGFGWPALSHRLANDLTLVAIGAGLVLFFSRLAQPAARRLSRAQDIFWPLLLVMPFISGGICANLPMSAYAYEVLMLIHVYTADLILVLIPFTKISHCMLAPFSQFVTALAWKFPPGAGELVAATLQPASRSALPEREGPGSVSGTLEDEVHAQ